MFICPEEGEERARLISEAEKGSSSIVRLSTMLENIAQCSGRDQNVQKVKRKSDFLFQKYFSITYLGSLPITW